MVDYGMKPRKCDCCNGEFFRTDILPQYNADSKKYKNKYKFGCIDLCKDCMLEIAKLRRNKEYSEHRAEEEIRKIRQELKNEKINFNHMLANYVECLKERGTKRRENEAMNYDP